MDQILVVDDEPGVRESLVWALERDGFAAREADSLAAARALVEGAALVVLDLMLPDGRGLDFLRELRAVGDLPVIVLTSRGEETDRVVGLELGADDYVVKPFSPREVVARVRAVLRRARARGDASPAPGSSSGPEAGVCVDRERRRVSVGGRAVELSRTEFDLLAALLEAPGRVFERDTLLRKVWGDDCVVGERTVDVHIKAIRRKLEGAGGDPGVIETVRGVGYRSREDA